MTLIKGRLSDFFEQGVTDGRTEKGSAHVPGTLGSVWAAVADQVRAFHVGDLNTSIDNATGHGHIYIGNARHPSAPDIGICDNENGTFRISGNSLETLEAASPEQAVTALGKFCGKHGSRRL